MQLTTISKVKYGRFKEQNKNLLLRAMAILEDQSLFSFFNVDAVSNKFLTVGKLSNIIFLIN